MKAKKTVGSIVTSVGLAVGFAALASAAPGSITNTGPDSTNKIKNTTSQVVKVKNTNKLNVSNSNHQYATSGRAETEHNTTGGDATSGDASNATSLSISGTINNSGSGSALVSAAGGTGGAGGTGTSSISQTGPDSYNKIVNKVESEVSVTNLNDINVHNTNNQSAKSGSAEVSGNTTGGDATSGDASNTSSTSLTFNVSN